MSKKEMQKSSVSYLATECDKVGEIAIHYGFTVVKPPHITADDISKAKQFKEFDHIGDAEEKVALTRWYTEQNLASQAQPLLIHFKRPLKGSSVGKKSNEEMYGFEIMGSAKSTSEALMIKAGMAILSDMGYKDLYLDINTIGDKESAGKFERDIGSYFRKNSGLLSGKAKQEFKKNHYVFLKENLEENNEFIKSAPQTIGSLSELSRVYFKEVLEFIEAFEIPYKIKPTIFSNRSFASHTVFEIRQAVDKKEDGILLAYGYRYNYLAKKIGMKREIPSCGMTIVVKKNPKFNKKVIIKNIKKPKFYLVQLGETAKLKALNVVETLRKSKIPVYHSITKDKITGQLSGAEYMCASHVLIIGQKEAIENSVVVRNISTRCQETVFTHELADFLRTFL